MTDIRPFRAYRPTNEKANRIAALPYDVYSRQEAKEIVGKNPLSFLAIDRRIQLKRLKMLLRI